MTTLRPHIRHSHKSVEPYELAFKVRKDGVDTQYLYAYDTTGGVSSGAGIKLSFGKDSGTRKYCGQVRTPISGRDTQSGQCGRH